MFSKSSRSPYDLDSPSASTTRSPRRGPGGMEMAPASTRSSVSCPSSFSYSLRRAFPLACRARGAIRIHSSSRSSVLLPRGRLLLFHLQARLLLVEPRGVVPLPRDAAPAVELEDPPGDIVEEIPVVGDRHHGAGVLGEMALEPGDRLGVEVVGRLVEEQQVGLAQEQPAKRHAPPLAARERLHRHVAGRQAQGVHRDFELPVELPGVRRVDRVLQPGLLGEQLLHRRRRPSARRTSR